jgi:hypothetical protein
MTALHVKGHVVVVTYKVGSIKLIMRERPLTHH